MTEKCIHICYLADAMSPHTAKLAEYFQKKSFKVDIVSFDSKYSGEIGSHYVKTGLFSKSKVKYIVGLSKLKKEIKKICPDVLHAIYATSYGFAGAHLNFHPYIISVIGSDVAVQPKKSAVFKWLLQYATNKADAIHSQSQHLTDELVSLGVNLKKISTFTYGVEGVIDGPFPSAIDSARNGRTVVSTRAFESVYNIKLLISAIPLVLKKIPDAKFLIIGKGSQENELKNQSIKLKINSSVEFMGHLSHEKLLEVLKSADVYVSTSLSDGQSISLLEGMAAGAFPVVTDIVANQSWVRDGENGLLNSTFDSVDLANKIIRALSDTELRKRATVVNKKMIDEKGSFEKNMMLMEKIYLDLTGYNSKLRSSHKKEHK